MSKSKHEKEVKRDERNAEKREVARQLAATAAEEAEREERIVLERARVHAQACRERAASQADAQTARLEFRTNWQKFKDWFTGE